MVVILFGTPLWAADAPAKEGEAQTGDMTEVSKGLSNPVSSLWSLSFQQNNFMLDMGAGKPDHWNSNLVFQPVLPVALTKDWNLITRPVLTLFNSVPHPEQSGVPWTTMGSGRCTQRGAPGKPQVLSGIRYRRYLIPGGTAGLPGQEPSLHHA